MQGIGLRSERPAFFRHPCSLGKAVRPDLTKGAPGSGALSLRNCLLEQRRSRCLFSLQRKDIVRKPAVSMRNPIDLLYPGVALLACGKLYFRAVAVCHQLVYSRYCSDRLCGDHLSPHAIAVDACAIFPELLDLVLIQVIAGEYLDIREACAVQDLPHLPGE